jgi:hypothetical protein
MSRSSFGLSAFAFVTALSTIPAYAADYAVSPRQERYAQGEPVLQIDRGPNPYCGPRCGCPITVRVRHKQLVQYYPSGFDPRTRSDEPYYAYGANRTYVRYANPGYPEGVLEY